MVDVAKKPVVLVVGSTGAVGLKLSALLNERFDVVVRELEGRASPEVRRILMEDADLAVLCLPEAVSMNFEQEAPAGLRILDTSSSHRLTDGWVYGLAELDGGDQANRIRGAPRVANPGCYASGAILLLRPILAGRAADLPLQVAITAVGGVSTGGRAMLTAATAEPIGYRLYGLDQAHRHIPEIQRYAGLPCEPIFMPAVAGHQRGTLVQIPFSREHLKLSFEQVVERLQLAYQDTPGVRVQAVEPGRRFLDAADLAGSNDVVIQVLTDVSRSRYVLTALFDNLGKGAAGAAVQNIELMLGLAPNASVGGL